MNRARITPAVDRFTELRRSLPVDRLSTWALVGGVCGLLAAVPLLPALVSSLLLLTFIGVGPGSVGMQWVDGLPTLAVRALVPVLGLAVIILVLSVLLFMDVYSPRPTLLVLAAATTVAGVFEHRRAATAGSSTAGSPRTGSPTAAPSTAAGSTTATGAPARNSAVPA